MLTVKAVKGVVKGGIIHPAESIDAEDGTEVVISVPVARGAIGEDASKLLSEDEDFKAAEWRGEDEFWGDADAARR